MTACKWCDRDVDAPCGAREYIAHPSLTCPGQMEFGGDFREPAPKQHVAWGVLLVAAVVVIVWCAFIAAFVFFVKSRVAP